MKQLAFRKTVGFLALIVFAALSAPAPAGTARRGIQGDWQITMESLNYQIEQAINNMEEQYRNGEKEKDAFEKHLEYASRQVESWPAWKKRGFLGWSTNGYYKDGEYHED